MDVVNNIGTKSTPVPMEQKQVRDPADKKDFHLSYTRLSMFTECGMKYYFKYVCGLAENLVPPAPPPPPEFPPVQLNPPAPPPATTK